jgi:hypothetical protein
MKLRPAQLALSKFSAATISSLILFTLHSIIHGILASSPQDDHQRQQHLQYIIRDSYAEVSAFVVLHFSEKCKLAVHNCLFRTEWEKVFGGHERISHMGEALEKEEEATRRNHLHRRRRRSTAHHHHHNNQDQKNDSSYYYCQPYLIGKFCVDDYMRRPGDDWESNVKCLNDSEGNSPAQFKKSIYRDKCKFYYGYFFDAYNSATVTTVAVTTTTTIKTSFFSFLFLYFYYCS